jgi:CIC family chloride channel protein
LLPSLLVCSVAYLLSRGFTIFHNQVKSRIDSPAHNGEFFVDILQAIRVKDLMSRVRQVTPVRENMPFREFKQYFSQTKQHYFPVMNDQGRMVGIFSSTDIRAVLFSLEIEHLVVMRDIATSDIIVTTPAEDLNAVMQKFTTRNIDSLPVVQEDDRGQLIGMLDRRDVIAEYNRRVQELKARSGR